MFKRLSVFTFLSLLPFLGCTSAPEGPRQGPRTAAPVSNGCESKPPVEITKPLEGQEVPYTPTVEGRVPASDVKVWVVVHPLAEPTQFWVQEPVAVRSDCTWAGTVYFGEPNTHNQQFEVMAVGNPDPPIDKGQRASWPNSQLASKIITVTRR